MMLIKTAYTQQEIPALLRSHEIHPTSQRIEIARVLFLRGEHLSAEEIFSLVNSESARVSKATVYNTLGLFAERGLIREVVADPTRIFYDPNTAPHHHFYDTSTGKLMDIPAEDVRIQSLPALPDGMRMEGVDVIVRVCPNVQDTR
jgi:Fur family iron response transcriptional regulator